MQWKVSKEIIEIKPHGNADSLELAKVGQFQLVVGKGIYKTGDEIIFFPAKSIIPDDLNRLGVSEGESLHWPHLTGRNKDRVKEINLRGQLSQGVTMPIEQAQAWVDSLQPSPMAAMNAILAKMGGEVTGHMPSGASLAFKLAKVGEDISALLCVTKYEPPIPTELAGQVTSFSGPSGFPCEPHKHDVVQHGVYQDAFEPDEEVIISEKLHGSHGIFFIAVRDGKASLEETQTGSKGLFEKGLLIKDSPTNAYWRALRSNNLESLAEQVATTIGKTNMLVHFIGEVIPVQKGFTYGYDNHSMGVRLFGVLEPAHEDPEFDLLPDSVHDIWCPILYRGPYKDAPNLFELCKGKEQVSGKELHIREGIVIVPVKRRRAADGTWLKTKIINPRYSEKATGEELS